jgi:hypothetical protein
MGTAILEAKLAQQLAHLEQEPFYGVFLDLKKAFDAMNRERCLLILEGYGAGPLNPWWGVKPLRDGVTLRCWGLGPHMSNQGTLWRRFPGITGLKTI